MMLRFFLPFSWTSREEVRGFLISCITLEPAVLESSVLLVTAAEVCSASLDSAVAETSIAAAPAADSAGATSDPALADAEIDLWSS